MLNNKLSEVEKRVDNIKKFNLEEFEKCKTFLVEETKDENTKKFLDEMKLNEDNVMMSFHFLTKLITFGILNIEVGKKLPESVKIFGGANKVRNVYVYKDVIFATSFRLNTVGIGDYMVVECDIETEIVNNIEVHIKKNNGGK